MKSVTKKELSNIKRASREMCEVAFYSSINDFSGFLKDLLKFSGITHRRFNEIIGAKSSGHISNIISGHQDMSMKHVVKIADLMQLNKGEKVCLYEWRSNA